jgi:N-acetylneuraminic acid mutarotase
MESPTRPVEPLLPGAPEPKPDPPIFKRSPARALMAVLFIFGIGTYLMLRPSGSPPLPAQLPVLQPASWRTAASEAPTPRTEVTAAVLNGRAYVIGGLTADSKLSNAVDVFDLKTEEWSKGPPLPAGRHHTTAVTYGGKIYVIGGFAERHGSASKAVYIFDGQKWQDGPALHAGVAAHAAAVLGNHIYVVGGVGSHGRSLNTMYSLDVAAGVWQAELSMSVPRNHLAAAGLDNKLYAIGGRDEASMLLDAAEVYDPGTGEWSRAGDLPTGRSGITAAVLGGKIYVIGGESKEKTFTEVEVLDGSSGKWTKALPLPSGRHGLGSAATDRKIFVFLGGPQPGLTVSSRVQILQFDD